MSNMIDLTGKRFGMITVISMSDCKDKSGSIYWKCKCDCGEFIERSSRSLLQETKHIRSCGCFKDKMKDISGVRSGLLVAIKPTDMRSNGRVVWLCSCDCGNSVYVERTSIVTGSRVSCGCSLRKDISNQVFGRLTAIEPTNRKKSSNSIIWKCLCVCGKIHYVSVSNLVAGNSLSCGCLQKDIVRKIMLSERNPARNPELTDEERKSTRNYPEYREWRTSIFERDNFTCKKCNRRGGLLNAHHIESYSKNIPLRTSLKNGITLCEECHKDLHHVYGDNVGQCNMNKWLDENKLL